MLITPEILTWLLVLFALAIWAVYDNSGLAKKSPNSKMKTDKMSYCPHCTKVLVTRDVGGGKTRLACSDAECKYIHWNSPQPVAAVIIPHKRGGIVLVKRKIPPKIGQYALPAGFVEPFENAEAGGIRETFEETGLKIEIDYILWSKTPERSNNMLIFFVAKPTEDEPVPGDESEEVVIVDPLNLPEPFAFPTHREAIAMYLKKRQAARYI